MGIGLRGPAQIGGGGVVLLLRFGFGVAVAGEGAGEVVAVAGGVVAGEVVVELGLEDGVDECDWIGVYFDGDSCEDGGDSGEGREEEVVHVTGGQWTKQLFEQYMSACAIYIIIKQSQ